MRQTASIPRVLILWLLSLGFIAWAIMVKLKGQPIAWRSRFGWDQTLVTPDRAAMLFGLFGAAMLLVAIWTSRDVYRDVRSRRHSRRIDQGLCGHCKYPRDTSASSSSCPECGKPYFQYPAPR